MSIHQPYRTVCILLAHLSSEPQLVLDCNSKLTDMKNLFVLGAFALVGLSLNAQPIEPQMLINNSARHTVHQEKPNGIGELPGGPSGFAIRGKQSMKTVGVASIPQNTEVRIKSLNGKTLYRGTGNTFMLPSRAQAILATYRKNGKLVTRTISI